MNKKLTNKGWQSMQQILDREMPVERKRRPLVWLWFLAFLLSGSLVLGWYFQPAQFPVAAPGGNSPVAEQAEVFKPLANEQAISSAPVQHAGPNTQIPVASDQSLPPKQNDVSAAAKNAATSNPEANNGSKKQQANLNSTMLPTELTGPETSTTLLLEKSIPTLQPEIQSTSKQDAPEQQELPTQAVDKTTNTETKSEETSAPKTSQPPSLLQTTPGPAVSAEPEPSEPNPTASPTTSPVIDPVAKRKTWAFGLTAGVFSTLNPGYSGANLGLTTEWQPNPKWGLRAGLAYQYHVLRNNERPILNISTSSYVEATSDQEILNSSNSSVVDVLLTPVYIPVSRLHRLEAPLQVFWQPLKRWRLYGGLAVGTTIYAQAGTRSLKDNLVFDIQSGTAAKNLNAEISTQVRNWDFRWNAGIGFKPNRHFAFDLFLHNPLSFAKISKNPYQDQFNAPLKTQAAELSAQRPDGAGALSLLQFAATWFF